MLEVFMIRTYCTVTNNNRDLRWIQKPAEPA